MMKSRLSGAAGGLASLAIAICTHTAAAADAPVAAKPAATRPATAAARPAGVPWEAAPRDAGWITTHAKQVEAAKRAGSNCRIAFVGDSITAGWANAGRDTWAAYYAPLSAVNLGIGGDRTEHVLYRLDHGALDHIKPKAIVLMIGTNNTHSNSAEDIAKGVTAIVQSMRKKLPQTPILLLAVFPRGPVPSDLPRQKVSQINERIAKLDDGKMVRYLDIGAKFLDDKGNGRKEVMPDLLHLSAEGYAIEAAAINPALEKMLGEKIVKHEVPAASKPASKPAGK